MKKTILLFVIPLFLISCDKSVKSESGAVDVISNVYFNASKGLDDHKQFHISKINYINDDIIELVPNILAPELIDSVFYIRDTVFYKSHVIEDKAIIFKEEQISGSPKSIYNKKFGAMWINIPIFDYDKRKDITDTILYNNKSIYKRFEINTPEIYSVYYIHPTDTILPYSLNPIVDKAYKGRLERIDSYDKKKDRFATICIIPRKKMDKEAQDIFNFNNDLKNEISKSQ
jgi:hypothetical protein